MAMRIAAFAVLAAALGLAAAAGAGTRAIHTHYAFSFSVAAKPDDTGQGARSVITGSGKGTFSIAHRQIDRDNTVFWDVVGAKGSFSLATGGKVFVTGTVTGGHFGHDPGYGGTNSAQFDVHIVSTTRFHCSKPGSLLGFDDNSQKVKGNLDGMSFSACSTRWNWTGVPPKLVVHVDPVSG